MFGFGSLSHLLVVLVLALILLGPKQLPEVARTLGRLLNELRRASNMFTDEFRAQMREEEHQRIIQPTPPQPAQEVTPQPQQEEAHYQLQLEPQPQDHTAETSTVATSSPDSHPSEEKKS